MFDGRAPVAWVPKRQKCIYMSIVLYEVEESGVRSTSGVQKFVNPPRSRRDKPRMRKVGSCTVHVPPKFLSISSAAMYNTNYHGHPAKLPTADLRPLDSQKTPLFADSIAFASPPDQSCLKTRESAPAPQTPRRTRSPPQKPQQPTASSK